MLTSFNFGGDTKMRLFKKQLVVLTLNVLVFLVLASTISNYTTSYVEGEADTGSASLVTNVSDLNSGDKIIIAGYDNSSTGSPVGNYSISTTQNSNNRGAQSVSVSSGNLTYDTDTTEILTLGISSTYWTLYANFSVTTGYLFSAGATSNNYLRTRNLDSDGNSRWTISISSNLATITSQGSATRNLLRLNDTNSPTIFSSYASGQVLPSIYKVSNSSTISLVDSKFYSQQFLTTTENKTNCTSDSGWSTLETNYNALSNDAKNEFKTNTTNQTIVNARARYNYLISFNNTLNDFVFGV